MKSFLRFNLKLNFNFHILSVLFFVHNDSTRIINCIMVTVSKIHFCNHNMCDCTISTV